ncbi:CRISPR-associated endonuclease Cas2 [Methanonatronarchaeum sp. AMET-Sl]|uniref:CRISPR-associated endonuclease Cas2 n=1 Tax=Methanonatronarchaeum sp. AMET-Sl TaxID=3037654 RepID=UPI00244DAEB6|nr:CRISPR-associated endonuclease Cas2 [Methanonatronarchaeum sp. AMET-Sl]WGI17881.1 CRISPR-associated endonuclease Cas2 [Methanonatronarchaeum sp. AMET-Sl]
MRLVVTYDIRSDTRRRKVYKILESYGAWKQYSVFELEITKKEKIELIDRLSQKITKEDNIRIYTLCKKCAKEIEELGKKTKENKDFVI